MKFVDRHGYEREGELVGNGPRANTVWIMLPDRSFAAAKLDPKGLPKQVEYEVPGFIQPLPKHVETWAQGVVDRYREVAAVFRASGIESTPNDPEHTIAVAVLKKAELARQSRQPFLAARGGNNAVGDKRFKDLATESESTNGETHHPEIGQPDTEE